MIKLGPEQALLLVTGYDGPQDALIRELGGVIRHQAKPVGGGIERADRLLRTFQIRLNRLAELGIEAVGADVFRGVLDGLDRDEVALFGVSSEDHTYTSLATPDTKSLLAVLRVPANKERRSMRLTSAGEYVKIEPDSPES